MRRMIGSRSAIIFLAFVAMVTSCSEPGESPITGNWIPIERYRTGGPDWGYSADWTIYADGTYNLEFGTGTIAGPISGSSSGRYSMLADSIMVYTSLEHANLSSNYLFQETDDTLFIHLLDSELTTSLARAVGPSAFERYGITVIWEKK